MNRARYELNLASSSRLFSLAVLIGCVSGLAGNSSRAEDVGSRPIDSTPLERAVTEALAGKIDDARELVEATRVQISELCGPLDWRLIDATLTARYIDDIAKLSADERRRLTEMHALYNESQQLYGLGKLLEAREKAALAMEGARATLGDDHDETARMMNALASLCLETGEYKVAGPLLEQVAATHQHVGRAQHPDYARTLNNQASLAVLGDGDFALAEKLLREALDLKQQLGLSSDATYSRALSNLGWLYLMLGDYRQAGGPLRESLKLKQRLAMEMHPDYANNLLGLARLRIHAKDYETAKALVGMSKQVTERSLGKQSELYGRCLRVEGQVLLAEQHIDEAVAVLREAAATVSQAVGADTPSYASCLPVLGRALAAQGHADEARQLLEDCLTIQEPKLPTTHPDLAETCEALAELYRLDPEFKEDADALAARAGDIRNRLRVQRARLAAAPIAKPTLQR